jgi:hypothetical protein
VGAIVFAGGGDAPGPDSRFDTANQAAARGGLYGKADTTHRPTTSAGYRTSDGGLIREQVYAAVRQLDAGRMTGAGFRERLAALGVPVPVGVDKLIAVYENNGKADFGRFVRAFEEYFAAATRPGAEPAPAGGTPRGAPAGGFGGSAIPREALTSHDDRADLASPIRPATAYRATADAERFTAGSTSGGAFYSPHIAPLQRGHGDILGWSSPPTAGEAEQAARGRGRPNRTLYDTHSPALDIVSVAGRERLALSSSGWHASPTSEREVREVHSRRHLAEARYRDSGPILGWGAGGDSPSVSGGAAGGDGGALVASEFALVVGRGRAHVADNPMAAKDRAGPAAAPYATDE